MNQPNENIAANGSASLSERVQGLRLTGREEIESKSGGRSWLPWLLCLFLAIGWAGFGIKWYSRAEKKDPTPTPAANRAGTDATGDGISLEVKGYLIPTQQISISPIDVAGRVVTLNIEEGKSFQKNDILAEIESTPYLAQLAEAKAQVAAAKARLAELDAGTREEEKDQLLAELDDAKAQLVQLKREWDRFAGSGTLSITTREYELAQANYLSGIKRVQARQKAYDLAKLGPRQEKKDASKAELNAAEARLTQSQWRLDNCTIRSPVTGVILTKKAEVGSLINPVVGGVSTNLCDIADLRKLEVDLEVQERDISKVRLDQKCTIKPDAFPNRIYEGYVERMMPIANRAKSVVPVRIKVVPRADEKQGQYLKPEMGVTVTFRSGTVTDDDKKRVKALLEDDSPKSIEPK
jgi:multidrug resistance efflux pump